MRTYAPTPRRHPGRPVAALGLPLALCTGLLLTGCGFGPDTSSAAPAANATPAGVPKDQGSTGVVSPAVSAPAATQPPATSALPAQPGAPTPEPASSVPTTTSTLPTPASSAAPAPSVTTGPTASAPSAGDPVLLDRSDSTGVDFAARDTFSSPRRRVHEHVSTRSADAGDVGRAATGWPTRGDFSEMVGLDTPRGTREQIALRFVSALKRQQWPQARSELAATTRQYLTAYTEDRGLSVLVEARQHAGGDRLEPCTNTRRVNDHALAVRCGTELVVVHVEDLSWPGVLLGPDHVTGDVLVEPHTHAYSDQLQ